ncbi:uncharacterized protein LOC128554803, partial [Mercenaria mercenaria]|uniref:uncharacterized protein LOC128554803 n=1 Tax=Mercenaria mercenaria TaxID=6596 RepID=UPI00234F7D64
MSDRHQINQNRSPDYNDRYQSLPDRTSSKSRSDARENKDILLRDLLGLLSTDVQELVTSLWKHLDNEPGQNRDLQSKESEILKLKKDIKALQDENDRLKLKVSTTMQTEVDAKIKSLQKKI